MLPINSIQSEILEELTQLDNTKAFLIHNMYDMNQNDLIRTRNVLRQANQNVSNVIDHVETNNFIPISIPPDPTFIDFPRMNNSFEMVTTISTTTPGNVPNSLFDAISRMMGSDPMGIGNHNNNSNSIVVPQPPIQEDVVVPLPLELIKQMQSKKVKSKSNLEEPCSVCFDEFKHGERYRELPCNHCFHKRCIDKWFAESVKCPMCRQDIRDLLNKQNSND